MNILLTGPSGTIGQEILKLIVQNKAYNITVFDKKTKLAQKKLAPYKNNIKIIYGDLTKKKEVERACQSQDMVFHLAAIIPPLAEEKPDLAYQVNTIGTQNIVKSLEEFSPTAFLIYASSVSVYGDRIKDYKMKVGDPLIPSDYEVYPGTKIKAEAIVQKSTLNWSIFRLSSIIGFNNHKLTGLMFHMPLATLMEFTTPADTGRAFANAIDKKEVLKNRIFNLGGGEKCWLSYKDFLEKSFEIFGLGAPIFPEKSFAEKNFHCGFYIDGHELNDILDFRRATAESYFEELKEVTNPVVKFLTSLFRKPIQKHILKKSEPYHAFLNKDKELMKRFFND